MVPYFRQFMYLVISLLVLNRIWDLIVSVPDHCLSFYFESTAYMKFAKLQYVSSGFRCRVTDEALLAETT